MNEEFSKTRFALPVAVTLASHAFLFFGFNSQKTPPPPPAVAVAPPANDRHVVEIAEPPKPEEGPESGGGSPSEFLPPSLPEPPPGVVAPDSIPVRVEPSDQRVVTVALHRIDPAGFRPLGEGDGSGREFGTFKSFRSIDLDNTPRVKFSVPPVYPYEMRTAGISGEVWVEFTVSEEGQVLNARVIRSSNVEFESPTLRAVYKWRFESGKRQGRPVKFRMSLPVVYSLGNETV